MQQPLKHLEKSEPFATVAMMLNLAKLTRQRSRTIKATSVAIGVWLHKAQGGSASTPSAANPGVAATMYDNRERRGLTDEQIVTAVRNNTTEAKIRHCLRFGLCWVCGGTHKAADCPKLQAGNCQMQIMNLRDMCGAGRIGLIPSHFQTHIGLSFVSIRSLSSIRLAPSSCACPPECHSSTVSFIIDCARSH